MPYQQNLHEKKFHAIAHSDKVWAAHIITIQEKPEEGYKTYRRPGVIPIFH